jgi:hypothetical protein
MDVCGAKFWWSLLLESLSTFGTPPSLNDCTHLETVWYTMSPLPNASNTCVWYSCEFILWRTGELLFAHRNTASLYRFPLQNEIAKALMLACKMHVHSCTSHGNIYKLHSTRFEMYLVHFPCCHIFYQQSKCHEVRSGPCIGLINICYIHVKYMWYCEYLT